MTTPPPTTPPTTPPTPSYPDLSPTALTILERRYLRRNPDGEVIETPDEMFRRVAHHVASAEKTSALRRLWEETFYDAMRSLRFMPNSPTLMNAGTDQGTLSACFVVPVNDSLEEILQSAKDSGMIQKYGGGIGYSLSRLRQQGDYLNSTQGAACGPNSILEHLDDVSRLVTQGGKREGANMGVMRYNHPDILAFVNHKLNTSRCIACKSRSDEHTDRDHPFTEDTTLKNFNISVAVDQAFFDLVESGGDIPLVNYRKLDHPITPTDEGTVVGSINAKVLFDTILHNAHANGDPGLLFMEHINQWRSNPILASERGSTYWIDATNPCVSGDTLILTRTGWERIDTLVEEPTEIWNGEAWSLVTPRVTGHDQDILRVTLSNGMYVDCTAYHKFALADGREVEAQDLKPGMKLEKLDSPPVDGDYSNIKPFTPAYLAGFYGGDGYVHQGQHRSDRSILHFYGEEKMRIGRELEAAGLVKLWAYDATQNRQSSQVLIEVDKKYVPVQAAPRTQLEWLAGLLDADGTVAYSGRGYSYQISSIDKEFLRKTSLLIRALGGTSTIGMMKLATLKDMPGGIYYTQDCYRITIPASSVVSLLALGLPVERLFKGSSILSRKATRFPIVESIVPNGHADDVYCFTEPYRHRGVFNGILQMQCGEEPLLDWDSCNLGHLNLANYYRREGIVGPQRFDYDAFAADIVVQTRFLDNVITANYWPLPQIKRMADDLRHIGSGVMGWSDLLFRMRIPYGSDRALNLGDTIATFFEKRSWQASRDLAVERGPFPLWEKSIYNVIPDESNDAGTIYPLSWAGVKIRNAIRTTIAPTGTTSLIAGCSSSIEPAPGLSFTRQHKTGRDPVTGDLVWMQFDELNPWFEEGLKDYVASSDVRAEVARRLATQFESLRELNRSMGLGLPQSFLDVFSVAAEISPEWHVRMQAAWQDHIDSGVSKTINMPENATVDDFRTAYTLANELGCLGITCYRDNSRSYQVLNVRPTDTDSPQTPIDQPTLNSGLPTTSPLSFPPISRQIAESLVHAESPVQSANVAAVVRESSDQPASYEGYQQPPTSPTSGRRKLDDDRVALTHHFKVADQDGYLTIGFQPNGDVGEIFIKVAKQGSTVHGFADAFAIVTSVALQWGVPPEELWDKLENIRFEPHGMTRNQAIPITSSIVDYIARYMKAVRSPLSQPPSAAHTTPPTPTTPFTPTTSSAYDETVGTLLSNFFKPREDLPPSAFEQSIQHSLNEGAPTPTSQDLIDLLAENGIQVTNLGMVAPIEAGDAPPPALPTTTPSTTPPRNFTGAACPDCGARAYFESGCLYCPVCGWSRCG